MPQLPPPMKTTCSYCWGSIVVRLECPLCVCQLAWNDTNTSTRMSTRLPCQRHSAFLFHPSTSWLPRHARLRISNEPTSRACRTVAVEYFRSHAAPELCFELSITVYASLSATRWQAQRDTRKENRKSVIKNSKEFPIRIAYNSFNV